MQKFQCGRMTKTLEYTLQRVCVCVCVCVQDRLTAPLHQLHLAAQRGGSSKVWRNILFFILDFIECACSGIFLFSMSFCEFIHCFVSLCLSLTKEALSDGIKWVQWVYILYYFHTDFCSCMALSWLMYFDIQPWLYVLMFLVKDSFVVTIFEVLNIQFLFYLYAKLQYRKTFHPFKIKYLIHIKYKKI